MNNFSVEQINNLISVLKVRFETNMHRHKNLSWNRVEEKLKTNEDKLLVISEMEKTGGEPDIIYTIEMKEKYIYFDCAKESPEERRSVCYDDEALEKRKENTPKDSAIGMALKIGVSILDEEQYRMIQSVESFDNKTSSWIKTPEGIRKLGGALFADYRYNNVFIYHNGAESYYSGRGFRGYIEL